MMKLTKEELCYMFDHTLLKPYASEKDFKQLCDEAKELGVHMVAINSEPVALCHKLLKETNIHVGAAISFPLGQTELDVKLFETKQAITDGADEIDYVINIAKAKMKDYDYLTKEMRDIVTLCHQNNVICKVIFENCYLDEDEKIKLCEIAKEVKPDFIKTSTGFGTSGATVEDVALMKSIVGDAVEVKAAGGIRDYETCMKMINAGATRIGTSSAFDIIKGYKEANK